MGRGAGLKERVGVARRQQAAFGDQSQSAHVETITRTSSKGVQARLELYHGIDDGISRGWVVDLVEIHTDDGPAGYLKISFIPEANRKKYFANAFQWAVNHTNRYGFSLGELLEKSEQEWKRTDYWKALKDTDGWMPYGQEGEIKAAREDMDTEELAYEWTNRRQQLTDKHQREYDQFCEFHVDRPHVDFIRVYDYDENRVYDGGQRKDVKPATKTFRGQGLSTLMYETGALWTQAQGLEFYASGLQSHEAAAAWGRLEDKGLVLSQGKRRVFNTSKFLEENPDLALNLK